MPLCSLPHTKYVVAAAMILNTTSTASAETPELQDRNNPAVVAVQSMMDELFPKIEASDAGFRTDEDRAITDASLERLLESGLSINFFSRRVNNCAVQTLMGCQILNSGDSNRNQLVLRYAISFLTKLGLGGSEWGNEPLPARIPEERADVHYWINWSQCFQPASYPSNAITCAQAYHPLPQPSPGVRAVFETSDDKVIALHFFINDTRVARRILNAHDRRAGTQ